MENNGVMNGAAFCAKCGAPLEAGQKFCAKCGERVAAAQEGADCEESTAVNMETVNETAADKQVPEMPKACVKCGAELQEGQEFCAKCGQKVGPSAGAAAGAAVEAGVNTAINLFNENLEKAKKKPIIFVGVAVVAVVILVLIFSLAGGGKDFNKMYSDISGESWCTIAADGTWMQLDTNPYNIDDYMEMDAWNEIKNVLDDLGFASSVSEAMNQTRALDGRQSASSGDYSVSWTYHPDNGLEAMFEINK